MPSGFFVKHVSSYILDPKDPKDPKDSSYTHQTILLMQLHVFLYMHKEVYQKLAETAWFVHSVLN
jgi:hypothetical protein